VTGTLATTGTSAVGSQAAATTVAVVAIDGENRVVDSALTEGAFTLLLPPDRDYCLLFRDRTVSGATLGVLALPATGSAGSRGVFAFAPGTATVDLGTITLDRATGRALSNQARTAELVAPAAIYTDTDGDLIPDVVDRDDDGDTVADGSDCAPLDGSRSVTLTTGGCVTDDEDDDDDGVADTLDAAPLDPSVQVDAASDPDVVRLVDALGHWSLTFTITTTTFTDTFDFDLVQETEAGLFASGTNGYGSPAVIDVAGSVGYDYAIYTEGPIIGEAYFVDVSGATVTGVYYQTDPDTGALTSNGYSLIGSHTTVAVATRSIEPALDPAAAQLQRLEQAHRDRRTPSDPAIQAFIRNLMVP